MKKISSKYFVVFAIILFAKLIFAQTDTTAPEVYFISPGENAFWSCDSGVIVLKVVDESPIDWVSSHLDMFVNGSAPVVLEESLATPMDSFVYFPLPFSLSDGDSVRLSYLPIYDLWGNHRDVNFFFYVDLTPPEIDLLAPPEGVLPNTILNFSALCHDEMSGISAESSQVSVSVAGTDDWTRTINFSGFYSGDTLSVPINAFGELSGGDTVEICLSAADNAVGCGANRSDTCFHYFLPYTPPEIELIYPISGAIVSSYCADSIIFTVSDTDSLTNLWISFGDETLYIGDPRIYRSGDTFIVSTSSIFDSSGYYSITIFAEDIYNISSQYNFGLWADLHPPFVVSVTPASSTLITDTIIDVTCQIVDYLSGINPDSLHLTIDGIPHEFDFDTTTGFLTFSDTLHGVTDTATINWTICITGRDRPDFCYNYFDTCFN
ncbi:MAG TPA: hypothetical protein ENG11_02620, partial [candidate division Zixibacteria bacterium]|nr:hypothetical protein [candidate division Zixibacteria bacterium]